MHLEAGTASQMPNAVSSLEVAGVMLVTWLVVDPRRQQPAGLMYSDTGGDGPVVVLLHGVLMNGTLWDTVVGGLGDRYRCIVPELPFGAHTTPMPDDADLSLPALAIHDRRVPHRIGPAPRHARLQRLGRRATRHQPRRHRSCRQLGPGLL